MKSLVITGPTGAIGRALIDNCIENNISVLAICHRNSSRIADIPSSDLITIIEADLGEYNELFTDGTDNQYDAFIHLAWNGTYGNTRNDMPLQADNVKYALEAVELASRLGCKTFVGAGSQAEYGRVEKPLTPETPAFPENGYGMGKLAAGQMTRVRCEQLGIKHIWTRILSVYGPYDSLRTMVMSTLIKMKNNEDIPLTEGVQIWDYLFNEDAAKELLWLADNGKDGQVYCIGSGDARPLKSYIEEMHIFTLSKSRLGFGDVPYGDKAVMCLTVDKNCLVSDLMGLELTGFEEGIRRTLDYLESMER